METRLGPPAVAALTVFVLTGCVSMEPAPSQEQPDSSSEAEGAGGQDGPGQEESPEPEADPAELTYDRLAAEQIEYLLLDEDEWPYTIDDFELEDDDPYLSGYYAEWAEYWIPLEDIDYSSEEEDCFDGIAELDRIASDGRENVFVGGLRDNPNVSYEQDGVLLGISSFSGEQETVSVWEDLHVVCDGVEIEEDGDVITLNAVEQGGWNGVHMTVQAGSFFEEDLYHDDILLATLDRGENVVYAVGLDVASGTFSDVLRAQERKLDEGLPEDLSEGGEKDDEDDDADLGDEDSADQDGADED